MKADCTDSVYVPAGWTREELTHPTEFTLFTEPLYGGHVTVDYKARVFRLGIVRSGRVNSTGTYVGRGWREKLEQDACAHLHQAVNSR